MTAKPKISVVIPTYNHLEECVKPCVESILRTTDFGSLPMEIIVVANGCKDGTEDYVKSLGPPFKLLATPESVGFIKATNAGAAMASGEYLLFLNDDAQILDWGGNNSWLRMLMDPLEEDPQMAVTGSNRDAWSRTKWFIVMFCAMTRRKLFLDLGMLDEAFGLGCGEDCDYSLRVQARGMRISQVPAALPRWSTQFPIYHRGHVTFNADPTYGRNNTGILEERYPRTQEDRDFVRWFSEGLQ